LPWHQPNWMKQQLAWLAGERTSLVPASAPYEPGSSQQSLLLEIDGDQWWGQTTDGQRWPLITLEPAIHSVLPDLHGRWIELEGRPNPFGPWWRINRLCP
jgi:hypothetical protein